MEKNALGNQKPLSSMRNISSLNDLYSNLSMTKSVSGKENISCKPFPFIVDWQMHNHLPDKASTN